MKFHSFQFKRRILRWSGYETAARSVSKLSDSFKILKAADCKNISRLQSVRAWGEDFSRAEGGAVNADVNVHRHFIILIR